MYTIYLFLAFNNPVILFFVMYTLKQCQKKIEDKISTVHYPENPQILYDPIDYTLQSGGKRIRPSLLLLAYNLFDEKIDNALDAALAIEVFHNFTLLHDDLMDNSPIRRNRPTVYKKWNPNVAILSGDAMLIMAYQHLCKSPSVYLKNILSVFNQTALEVCEGQQYDMDFESRLNVEIDEYITMIRLKTAVLIAASLKIGAILGGAPEEEANKLYEYGINIGIAFQLQDDLLDVYGNEETFGKASGNDIVTNKKTYLLLTALKDADTVTLNNLTNLINNKTIDKIDKIKQVKLIYDDLNIQIKTEQAISKYFNKAFEILENVNVENIKKKVLISISQSLLGRNK